MQVQTAPSFKRAFWTLRRVLIMIGLLVILGVGSLIWWFSEAYSTFALKTLNSGAADTVGFFVASRIDQDYGKHLQPIVNGWSRSSPMKDAVTKSDANARALSATSLHNTMEVEQGEVALRDVLIYDTSFNLLARSQDGIGASLVLADDALRTQLAGRTKKEARLISGYRFASPDGTPLHSMIAPVGGFRAIGFMEVVTDPLGELADVGEILGGELVVVNQAGETLMTSSADSGGSNSEAPAELQTVEIALADPAGNPWAQILFTRDVSEFSNGVMDLKTQAVIAFLVGISAILIIVALMLKLTFFNNVKNFASAARALAAGDAKITLPRTGRDEIGEVRDAMEQLKTAVSSVFLMKHLVENTPTATAMIGATGRVEILNAAGRDSLGVASKADLETNFLGLRDQDARALTDANASAVETNVSYRDRNFAVSIAPVCNEQGEFLGSMLAWSDVTAEAHAKRMTEQLLDQAFSVTEAVAEQSKRLKSTAQDLNRQSTSNIDRTLKASNIAEGSSSDSNMVASSTQQLSASIEDINRRAEEANEISQDALRKAELGQERIGSLEVASNEIGSIVDLITDIAHRTRLLSLNATIEAHRAGEMGKGFNVVANEVKSLADQTSTATNQIAELTRDIQTHIGEATEVMHAMTTIIGSVNDIQSSIAKSVDEQHEATQEITATISHIADGSVSINNLIGEVNRDAQHTGENAKELTEASDHLAQSAEELRHQMTTFRSRFSAKTDLPIAAE